MGEHVMRTSAIRSLECPMNRGFQVSNVQPLIKPFGHLGENLGGTLDWLPLDAVAPPVLCCSGRNRTIWEPLGRLLALICSTCGRILRLTTPATLLNQCAPRRVLYLSRPTRLPRGPGCQRGRVDVSPVGLTHRPRCPAVPVSIPEGLDPLAPAAHAAGFVLGGRSE
jgi:hypothetical protein